MGLTEKQQRFADYWIETGNATEAATKAGYSKKTAAAIGAENLIKPNISEYIEKRLAEMASERIADATEVLTMLTRVMRREEDETVVVTCKKRISSYDSDGKKKIEEREEPVLVKIPTKVSDANRAAEMLAKRYGLLGGNVEIESGDSGIVINITPASQAPSEDDLS